MRVVASPVRSLSPLVEELRPLPDPWEACLRLAQLPNLLFLDSAASDSSLGRFSFVTADPFGWLDARQDFVREGQAGGVAWTFSANPFKVLARCLANYRLRTVAGLPPFQGGAAGLFGYGLGQHLERVPQPDLDEFQLPDLAVGFYDWVLAWDHVDRRAWIFSSGLPELQPGRRLRRARKRILEVRDRLRTPASSLPHPSPLPVLPARAYPLPGLPHLCSSFTPDGFRQAIARGIDYVHQGDCFQVNLAQRLLTPFHEPPLELYRRLRQRNPAPFAGYFDIGGAALVSASPERFLRVHNGQVTTNPIKGTRPRGRTPEEDRLHALELLASPKDRAENVMIVDLLRNDLGRVCSFGSISVEALCRLESYRTVHHLVSEVHGTLRRGLGPIDLLQAAFPGGSVTGAPKIRAMQIIAELEPVVRGPYCGSLGYLGFDGAMDTNILIRTFTLARGWAQFPVGGGIVADSQPDREYDETLHKAEGLLHALR